MKVIKNSKLTKEKVLANEFCVKDLAIEHLKEKSKCTAKAERYVDYVFERCRNDNAPMGTNKANKIRTLSEIM